MSEYLKIPEVARRLDVSEKTARRYIRSGELPSTFIGGAYRVSEEDLIGYQKGAIVKPEERTTRPKVEEAVSLEQWLEERCGHSYLAMSFGKLEQFIRDAEDLEEQTERRRILLEERNASVLGGPKEFSDASHDLIDRKYIAAFLVNVELKRVTPEEAAQEMLQKIQKLAVA